MKFSINIIIFILTTIGGFHLYLNISSNGIHSYEDSIKLLKYMFSTHPFKKSIYSLIILILSWLYCTLLNRIIFFRKSKKDKTQSNSEKVHKKTAVRDELKSELFKNTNPMYRVKSEYAEINIKDINDMEYPESTNWWKYDVFDLEENGVAVLDGQNILGFEIFMDENCNWDVITDQNTLRKNTNNLKLDYMLSRLFPMKTLFTSIDLQIPGKVT